jgi:four helix bundle protein
MKRRQTVNLEELEVYRVTMEIGERVWKLVNAWDYFAKDTVGKQFVKAADSMAANISEGFGRFFYKESKQFGYYARGSLYETKTWLTKAHNRGLVENEEYESLRRAVESVAVRLNNYIRSIGTGAMSVREDSPEYGTSETEVTGGCAAAMRAVATSVMPNDAPQAPMTTNDAAKRPVTRRRRP